jgi:hypothetical protein
MTYSANASSGAVEAMTKRSEAHDKILEIEDMRNGRLYQERVFDQKRQ